MQEHVDYLSSALRLDIVAHRTLTVEQFTKQAVPFANLPGHSSSLDVLTRLVKPSVTDNALDIACGPGIVACHLAPLVAHITGINITPEMIRQGQAAQGVRGLTNMTWQVAPAEPLPFASDCFSLVITRYSLHHFQHPEKVVGEMLRVCRPGGRILIAEVAQSADKVAA